MVEFAQFQQIVREQLAKDRIIRSVEAEGATVEAAVTEAAVLLSIPVRRMEYEIVERGFSGFWGAGQKNWKIKAYERFAASEKDDTVEVDTDEIEYAEAPIEDREGQVFVHFSADGALLKITPPQGKGSWVTEEQALNALTVRKTTDIDSPMISEAVRKADGEYVLVGQFEHNPADDAFVSVTITDEEMKALIYVNPPGPAGYDISFEGFMNILQSNNVVFGIDQEFLKQFADNPVYGEDIQAAAGLRPSNGRDAFFEYNFDIAQNKIRIREGIDGRVDFKELNIIQNVVEGQPLAKKIPAESGTAGKTVTGKTLPAKDGKDAPMPLGNNVRVDDDGLTILAEVNGQVLFVSGRISVESVYVVPGNVDIKSGNIIFLGNVQIKGNVEDGFSVKATGNIEVNGTVERAELDAEGDIIVHQGITGKGMGTLKAGRSLWARFIENATIEAGNMVVVSDGIINSHVDANKRIICQGKRANIVGGHLRAAEEINAKVLGSPTSGTETICEAGFDPKSKKQLDNCFLRRAELEEELEKIQLNLKTLAAMTKQQKNLPEDKAAYEKELTEKARDLTEDLRGINEEVERIQEFLNNLKNQGRISASSKVHPGVKIIIRDVREDVRAEYKAVTFILENGLIRAAHYEAPENTGAGPDGNTAD
ncbi:MAG: FapA family protein [Treponema sp.]|jgi:uncharacterized protein (DUF342 family)|nr:FapA family protein [Treponema sp.]